MAPSSTRSNQTNHLLPPKSLQNHEQTKPLPPTTSTIVKAMSIGRIVIGASALIAPRFTCSLFQFPIPANLSVWPRFFGIRDAALGELLITAENKESEDRGKREIRRALWAGMVVDAVDLGSILVAVSMGTIGRVPAVLIGGGAVSFIGLAGLALRGL